MVYFLVIQSIKYQFMLTVMLANEEEEREAFEAMHKLEKILDNNIGFYWWKKYVAAAFWANIATPMNLSITLFTALTTAQASSSSFLPHNVYLIMSIATMLVSVVNTFFKPHQQMVDNMKTMVKYGEYGNAFEEIYYSPCHTIEDFRIRTERYREVQKKLNTFRNENVVDQQNFFTDLLHLAARFTVLKHHENWLDLEKGNTNMKKVAKDFEEQFKNVVTKRSPTVPRDNQTPMFSIEIQQPLSPQS